MALNIHIQKNIPQQRERIRCFTDLPTVQPHGGVFSVGALPFQRTLACIKLT